LSQVRRSAFGADSHAHGSHEAHGGHGKHEAGEAAAAFDAVNAKMHEDMAVEYTGDADVDFVRGMIPHHKGAVEMAKIVLKHGKDPEIRKLAEDIIKAQDAEIAFMEAWLAKQKK